MTSLFHMNDSLEHRWLRNVAVDVLNEMQPLDYFGEIRRLLSLEDICEIYCACFSSEPDSLGQWRAYADDGYGVALGFDPNFFAFEKQGDFWKSSKHPELELC